MVDDLKLLIRSRHSLIVIETIEEQRAVDLIWRTAEALQVPMYIWTPVDGLRRVLPVVQEGSAGTQNAEAALAQLDSHGYTGVYVFKDLSGHLRNGNVTRRLRDLSAQFARDERTIILVDHDGNLPSPLDRLAVPFEIRLPDDAEIEGIVRRTFRELKAATPAQSKLTREGLAAIVTALRSLTEQEIVQAVSRAVMDDGCLDPADIPRLMDYKRRVFVRGGVLEFVPVGPEDGEVGGLVNLRRWLDKRRGALSPKAVEFGVEPPRGVLLLGVQGCGKSLAARMVAASWALPLLRLDPGSLYDKYVGETERRLRHAFQIAEATAPAVLWIDEIEKGFASAASQSTDGGLSKRMFGSLLNWMQERRAPIFCVATANDISALPPELLRKGRFDEIFFVDLPDADARREVFAVHLKRRKRDPAAFDLAALSAAAEGFSGAEIEQAVVSALYTVFADGRELTTSDVVSELAATRPLSITMAERIADLRTWAAGRCVAADG